MKKIIALLLALCLLCGTLALAETQNQQATTKLKLVVNRETDEDDDDDDDDGESVDGILSEILKVVLGSEGEAMDFELLMWNTVQGDAQSAATAMFNADPDADGIYGERHLLLSLSRIDALMQQYAMDHLIFRNGDGVAELEVSELLGETMEKLMGLILGGEEMNAGLLESDFASMDVPELRTEELSAFHLEIIIKPVEREDGSIAWWMGVYLCYGDQKLEISGLLKGFMVSLCVDEWVNAENVASFTDLYAVSYCAEDGVEAILLESELRRNPEDLPVEQADEAQCFTVRTSADGTDTETSVDDAVALSEYRSYVLTAASVGAGEYAVAEREPSA